MTHDFNWITYTAFGRGKNKKIYTHTHKHADENESKSRGKLSETKEELVSAASKQLQRFRLTAFLGGGRLKRESFPLLC